MAIKHGYCRYHCCSVSQRNESCIAWNSTPFVQKLTINTVAIYITSCIFCILCALCIQSKPHYYYGTSSVDPLTAFMLNAIWMNIRSDDKPALFRIQYLKTTFAIRTIWLCWWTKWRNWYVCVLLYFRSICLVCPVRALNWILLFSRIFCDKFSFKLNFPFYNVCVVAYVFVDWKGSNINIWQIYNRNNAVVHKSIDKDRVEILRQSWIIAFNCIRFSNARRFLNWENKRQIQIARQT